MKQYFYLCREPFAHTMAMEARGNHFGVIHDQHVAGGEIIRQVAHEAVLKLPAGPHDQHPGAIAWGSRPKRDTFFWQVEVEQGNVHRRAITAS